MAESAAVRRGVLYPARLPTFHREPAPAPLRDLIQWFWIPRWRLDPGRTVRQRLLPFPVANLVVEPDGVSLVGPTTGASHRDLTGAGWAVGALLRPAGLASLHPDPGALRDRQIPVPAAELHAVVAAAMTGDEGAAGRRRAVAGFAAWARQRLAPADEGGRLANAMQDRVAGDCEITRVDQVAERMGLSVRAVQRLTKSYVGLPPLAVIRRYRLQEAASRLREDPQPTVASIAAELGYADQAHLTADFRTVLGTTPAAYRRASGRP